MLSRELRLFPGTGAAKPEAKRIGADDSDLAELPCSILPSLALRNLVVAMLQARDAVKRRSWSYTHEPTGEADCAQRAAARWTLRKLQRER